MVTTNKGRSFAARYAEAMRKYTSPTDRQEFLKDLQALLDDRALPRMLRIKCKLALADVVDNWALESVKESQVEDDPGNPKWTAMAAAERAAKVATGHGYEVKVNADVKAKAVGS
ncbi:hypothetical protein B0A48_02561 [Cryoendolithus antarcticus]|uniref:Uncharacterized protein n=1 Tax=Cryoendolithus antarcticus TaxID=1507870 RepID=A0A1V8TP03_9PEZI|nr:hypothetical protein B0A48_02561 [Cryoendolithus antarcticus]